MNNGGQNFERNRRYFEDKDRLVCAYLKNVTQTF